MTNSNKKTDWIVTFKSDFKPELKIESENSQNPKSNSHNWSKDISVKKIYDCGFKGMHCFAKESDIKNHFADAIESCYPDMTMHVQEIYERKVLTKKDLDALVTQNSLIQQTGGFINRIGANKSSQKSGDGVGNLSANSNINVFVVDTGIYPHVDLNVVGGQNFSSADTTAWIDGNGHGTHVSGIIGARDNMYGIVGVAPGIKLWAVKVLGDNGSGSTSNIINGLSWILQNRGILWNGNGIVNMSLGGGANPPLDAAIDNLINNGIVVNVAAGNSSVNANTFSPARVLNAITVGATEQNPSYDTLAVYSNYGAVVDILAPGSNIVSTYLDNSYASLSGTSMACPVVTGTVALLLSTRGMTGQGTSAFSKNIINYILSVSSIPNPPYYDGTRGLNPHINIPASKPTNNLSIWSGYY